jgi:predicted Zn-dependent protease
MNPDSSSPDPATPAPAPNPPQPEPTVGFNSSPKRIALELGVVALVIVGVGVGAMWAGGAIAASLTPYISPEIDRQIGAAASKQMALLGGECPNPEAKAYVEKLAAPILEAAGEQPFEFQFRVVDDPTVNAFALPGGYVTVNRGLLEAAETGEEVAGVIGHELQHALLRHGTRRILRQVGGRALLWIATGGTDYDWMTQGIGTLTGLSYDREQESEADAQGLLMLTKAGIDPNGLATFFARLEKDGGPTPPALLSTHPDPGDRAEAVRLASAGAKVTTKLPSPKGVKCE